MRQVKNYAPTVYPAPNGTPPAFPPPGRCNLPASEKDHGEVSSSKVPGWVTLIKAPGTGRKLAQWGHIQAPLNT